MESEPDPLGEILFNYGSLLLITDVGVGIWFAAILIICLLICSALVSGSEVAFFSLSPNDFTALKAEDSSSSGRILKLREEPRTLLATILIANNFINIAITIISDYLLGKLLPEGMLQQWAEKCISWLGAEQVLSSVMLGRSFNFLIAVIGVTFLLVLFGEVAPKLYANSNNLRLARIMSGSLVSLKRVFAPMSNLLVSFTGFIERRLEGRTVNGKTPSKQDIDRAIELTVQGEENAQQEIDFLKSVVKFNDVAVKQIMKPRMDVIALDFRSSFENVKDTVKESGHSRLPVFDEDFDNVVGILHIKDLLGVSQESSDYEWQELINTEIVYAPEQKKISDLLKEFQEQRTHMAIVVDEYGGSSGLVTLEDIMEEVIGDFSDEFDAERDLDYKKIDEHNYIFEGKTLLNDLLRVLDLDQETFDDIKGDADSLAGLILEQTGDFPKAGKEFKVKTYKLKIVAVNKRRIEKIKITLPKT